MCYVELYSAPIAGWGCDFFGLNPPFDLFIFQILTYSLSNSVSKQAGPLLCFASPKVLVVWIFSLVNLENFRAHGRRNRSRRIEGLIEVWTAFVNSTVHTSIPQKSENLPKNPETIPKKSGSLFCFEKFLDCSSSSMYVHISERSYPFGCTTGTPPTHPPTPNIFFIGAVESWVQVGLPKSRN